MTSNAPAASRTVLLAGASGLVGREILHGLASDRSVAAVHCVGRRALQPQPRLVFHLVDFSAPASWPALPRLDEAYIALGTTIKVAGSQQAFRAIDFDAVVNTAKAARAAGATRLGVVSAMGANAHSMIFYNRVKGEMQDALRAIGFETLVIAQPSFLVGERTTLGQPVRSGEKLASDVSRIFRPLIPANYRSIRAADVAAALLKAVPTLAGEHVLHSGEMQRR